MKRKSHPARIMITLSLCCIFAFLAVPTWGQEVTAAIVGSVNDPTGAAISGATITATDVSRGTVWTVQTNNVGAFNIPRLPIGTYDVKAVATGFQPVKQSAVTLNLNQTARVNFNMTMGSKSETVEVTGAAPLLQTQSTEVSTIIDAATNVALPLAGRNYLQLTLLAPGATTNNPRGMSEPQTLTNASRPFINGNREQANQYFLDGQLNSEDKNNETGFTPNIDTIQEFNIITQNASAEFGNYQGGVISVSTKSGTNSFHGDLFEFLRNDMFNANLPSNGWSKGVLSQQNTPGHVVPGHAADGTVNKPEFRYNLFGGTIGGPIIKNKLFFFADYQGIRDVNAGPTGAQLLTKRMRGGDFGQLCTDLGGTFTGAGGACTGGSGIQLKDPANGNANFANNVIPIGRISGVASKLFGMPENYPLPQSDSMASGNNFFFKTGNALNTNQGGLKIDYNVSSRDHIFGRWSQMYLDNPTFSGCLFCASGAAQGSQQSVRNAVIDWTHTFNSNILNDVRIGFNAVRFDQSQVQTSSLGNIGEQLGIAGSNFEVPGLLNINIPAVGVGGNADLGQLNLVQIFHTTQGQFNDNLTFTHGRHSTKTGFQYVRLRQNYLYNGNNGALGSIGLAAASGSGLSDLFLGLASTGGVRDAYVKPVEFGDRGSIFAAYVQDDWRITNTLTLNLGLRFEDHTPLNEIQDRAVNFDLVTGAIQTPTSGQRALYNNYLGIGDWQPRFGFAWSPGFMNGKSVLRGGFAISSFFEGGGANEQVSLNPPYGIIGQSPVGGTLAAGYAAPTSCTAINQACYAGKRIRVTDQNIRPAMNQQWNLTIQHQISNSLTAQIGYVGQHGTHLLNFVQTAQLQALNAAGTIAKPGEQIVSRVPGPYLGGGTAGSLYRADNSALGGADAIAGTNMSNASQSYNALQAVLQKRMSNGLQGQVAYTYSKCLSNSPGYFGTGWGSTGATSSGGQPGWQNSYDGRADWGPCFFDQTHVLSSYVTYQLPVGKGKQFGHDISPALNAVVGNWEIGGIVSLHTGNALTLNEFGGWGAFNGDSSGTNGIGNYFLSARPNCTGPISILNKHVDATPTTAGYIQWFDTSNVSHPSNSFGTCSVGNIRGPGYANVDMSLHKDFPLTENKRLEFRFEALNALNHPVWTFSGGPAGGSFDPGTPVSSGNSNFGNITGSQSARQLQFALKFYF
ncbi:MAG: hypothetical protein JWN45_1881 [Acidobacteriaceae bacterium]|nr:hypothetical protein [Acidobacteriaceae bacterium]